MLHGAVVVEVTCVQARRVLDRRPEVLFTPTPPLASHPRLCCESCLMQAASEVTTGKSCAYVEPPRFVPRRDYDDQVDEIGLYSFSLTLQTPRSGLIIGG